MSLISNVQKTIADISDKAHKKFNITKLELKIKSNLKEVDEMFMKIGKSIYWSKKNNTPVSTDELNYICKDIEKTMSKTERIGKQIENIKKNNVIQEQNIVEKKEITYATLNKKENDLKILRTDDGIQFLKFCSECQTGNTPDSNTCIKCGHIFK